MLFSPSGSEENYIISIVVSYIGTININIYKSHCNALMTNHVVLEKSSLIQSRFIENVTKSIQGKLYKRKRIPLHFAF